MYTRTPGPGALNLIAPKIRGDSVCFQTTQLPWVLVVFLYEPLPYFWSVSHQPVRGWTAATSPVAPAVSAGDAGGGLRSRPPGFPSGATGRAGTRAGTAPPEALVLAAKGRIPAPQIYGIARGPDPEPLGRARARGLRGREGQRTKGPCAGRSMLECRAFGVLFFFFR